MSFLNGMPANFTISDAAKTGIDHLREVWLEGSGYVPDVLAIAWGTMTPDRSGASVGLVVVSFYPLSYRSEIAHALETVSGKELLFFITAENYHRFEGKVLDHSAEKSFYLR